MSWVTETRGIKPPQGCTFLDAGVLSPRKHTEEGLKWTHSVLKPLLPELKEEQAQAWPQRLLLQR